jgi:PKD repeat protein
MVEFALIFPVILFLLLVAIDFGRVYLGWVNVQQMVRIAANDAADHASAWQLPDTAAKQAERNLYQKRIARDAKQINCLLPNPIPDPVIAFGTSLGSHVTVGIDCRFSVVTPIISSIVGGTVLVSADTTFPIKEGVVAAVPGGGAPIAPPPVAKFFGTPLSGWSPLTVVFTDTSTNGPTSWLWTFNDDIGGTGTGSLNATTSTAQGPHTVQYTCTGALGDTCTFSVSLRVRNPGGEDTVTKTGYVTVKVRPLTGPIAEFSGTPLSGIEPVTTTFQFVNLHAGVVYTNYEWDCTSDGTTWEWTGATRTTAVCNYPTSGSYDVTLRVTDNTGAQSTLTKVGYVNVQHQVCTVPNFFNTNKNQAQNRWSSAGFSTQVLFQNGQGNYNITYQSINGSTVDPQPAGCASIITVGP